jgi:hypothetical protein
MKRGLLACIALLLANLPAIAQQTSMGRWLNTGTDQERVEKLVSLGVNRRQAQYVVGLKVKWQPLRSEPPGELAIIFLPCGNLDSAFVDLLERTDQAWHFADSAEFDCHYDNSVSVETKPLRNPNVDDVLVHHECEVHGTGLLQQNFNVFAVVSSKLKLVLNAEEIVNASGFPIGSHELVQRSLFVPVAGSGSGPSAIEETRCSKLNGRLIVQRRYFQWSESLYRFVPSRFVKVPAPIGKSMPTCP